MRNREFSVSFPIKTLRVVGVASKHPTRYAFDDVHVVSTEFGKVTVEATDAKCAVRCFAKNTEKDEIDILVPGGIARSVLKIADSATSKNPVPTATVYYDCENQSCRVVFTSSGCSTTIYWTNDNTKKFPSIDDIVPKHSLEDRAAGEVGLNAALLATVVHTVKLIAGKSPSLRIKIPTEATRPIEIETLADEILVKALVMQVHLK